MLRRVIDMCMINDSSRSGVDCLHTARQNTAEDIMWLIMRASEISFCLSVFRNRRRRGLAWHLTYRNGSNLVRFGHNEDLSVEIATNVCGYQ
jgi:hypothetical protein